MLRDDLHWKNIDDQHLLRIELLFSRMSRETVHESVVAPWVEKYRRTYGKAVVILHVCTMNSASLRTLLKQKHDKTGKLFNTVSL